MNQVMTHTYWMTYKEYEIWIKSRPNNIAFNNNSNITRTHIHFI